MGPKALPRVLSRSPGARTVRGDGGGENRSGDQPHPGLDGSELQLELQLDGVVLEAG